MLELVGYLLYKDVVTIFNLVIHKPVCLKKNIPAVYFSRSSVFEYSRRWDPRIQNSNAGQRLCPCSTIASPMGSINRGTPPTLIYHESVVDFLSTEITDRTAVKHYERFVARARYQGNRRMVCAPTTERCGGGRASVYNNHKKLATITRTHARTGPPIRAGLASPTGKS